MKRKRYLLEWLEGCFRIENGEIILETFTDVENVIDLFDERFTRSEITNEEYYTEVKKPAERKEIKVRTRIRVPVAPDGFIKLLYMLAKCAIVILRSKDASLSISRRF